MTTFISQDPMTGETLWKGSSFTEKDVDAAVASARKMLPTWSSLPLEERVKILLAFQETLITDKATFAEKISREVGKPLWESVEEVSAMIAKVDISIEAQQKRCPETVKNLPIGVSITRHKPLGVVAILGPFNFPGHLPNGHIVPALLAGNTVVFKPSELTPWVGEEMIRLWERSGLPPGVLNLVQGGAKTGRFLSRHPDLNALLFTGSWKTGQALAKQFGSRPDILLALEMGGNNPIVIGDISNLSAAAYLIIQSAYLSAGQRCTCARRLIIPEGTIGDSLLQELSDMISTLRIGAYTKRPEPFMGPVITRKAMHRLLATQKTLIEKGGKALLAMKALQPGTPLLSPGLMDVTKVPDLPDEEIFGPFLQVLRVPDFATAIKEARNTAYGLATALLSDNPKQYEEFYKKSRSGTVNWNTPTTGASSSAPFGGVGHSGNYRPSAFYAADYCNYPVASLEADKLTMPKKIRPGINTMRGKTI